MKASSSIYLVFGEDDYLVEQGTRRVLSHLADQAAGELAVETVDCKDKGVAGVLEEIASPSLFSLNKAIVLRRFQLTGKNKIAVEIDKALAAGLASGQFIVLVPDKVDKRLRMVKAIARQGGLVECNRFSHEGLREWILERFREEGKSAPAAVAEALIELKGDDLRTLDSEIEKAVTYAGKASKVTQKDIEVLVGRSRVERIYELVTHVLLRQVGEAMETLSDFLEANESPVGIVYRIAAAVRGLLIVKIFLRREKTVWQEDMRLSQFSASVLPSYRDWVASSGIDHRDALLWGRPQFVYYRFKEGSGFEFGDLVEFYGRLLDANRLLVSTSVSPKAVLERLIASLER